MPVKNHNKFQALLLTSCSLLVIRANVGIAIIALDTLSEKSIWAKGTDISTIETTITNNIVNITACVNQNDLLEVLPV